MIQIAPVYWYDTLDSTNEEARRRAGAGETGPLWIAAKTQTAGRGRLGRPWQSQIGNLFCTCLIPVEQGASDASKLPFAAGLAVREACVRFAPDAALKLKWPNDVRADGAKLSGILVETGGAPSSLWAAIGIGVNVASSPTVAEQQTTSLAELGAPPGLEASHLLEALGEAFSEWWRQAQEDFSGLLRAWESHAEGLGQPVEINALEARISGVFQGLADDGSLVLQLQDGTQRLIRAGDVNLMG